MGKGAARLDSGFEQAAGGLLERLLTHYRGDFEITYREEIADITVPALAQMHLRSEKSLLGLVNTKTLGKEANEYIYFLMGERFDKTALEQITTLLGRAVNGFEPAPEHGYTFYDAVFIADSVDENAAKALKKYKLRRDFRGGGWAVARAAVVTLQGGEYSSRDGGDFKNLLRHIIIKQGE